MYQERKTGNDGELSYVSGRKTGNDGETELCIRKEDVGMTARLSYVSGRRKRGKGKCLISVSGSGYECDLWRGQ